MPESIRLDEIQAARVRIGASAIRTPLVKLNVDGAPADIYLKLENLQPIGSFKIRGASNAMALASAAELSRGVFTASAGNMAQGVAWNARRLGIPCTAVVPDHAPEAKLAAITRLGATYIKVPFDAWWEVILTSKFEGLDGFFVHPVSHPAVMAGNGTIGLEILEDLPDVDAIIAPYGGGGLSVGIASAVKALKPDTKVYASEVETSAALAAALTAGKPVRIDYQASFVDGIGSSQVMADMWELARRLLDGSLVSSLEQVSEAIRLLISRNHVVAEGAGGSSVAAAIAGKAGPGKVVCIVSGGNIDLMKLAGILRGT